MVVVVDMDAVVVFVDGAVVAGDVVAGAVVAGAVVAGAVVDEGGATTDTGLN